MAIEVKVPEVGESITEVEIGNWLKAVGDAVQQDENLVVIETDKATVEIVAPQSGTLSKILRSNGETAHVGEVIGQLESLAETKDNGQSQDQEISGGAASAAKPAKNQRGKNRRPADGAGDDSGSTPKHSDDFAEAAPAATEPAQASDQEQLTETVEPLAKPSVEVSARNLRPDAAAVSPMLSRHAEASEDKQSVYELDSEQSRQETIVKMTPLRRRVAERLVNAQQTAALLTTFNEIDMSAVNALRQTHHDDFKDKYEVKLGLMSFFVKAAIEALRLVPEINAEIRGESIVYRNYFDIGVAVGGGRGLVVPVLRNAERMSFADIEKAIADFARRARENKIKPDELQGGTFTITNGGVYGSLLSTPIINPPQSAIVGMHAIQDRPVARDGAVVIRPMMYVALTYDHRIIDGREAVTFLKQMKTSIEEPVRMLLQV